MNEIIIFFYYYYVLVVKESIKHFKAIESKIVDFKIIKTITIRFFLAV